MTKICALIALMISGCGGNEAPSPKLQAANGFDGGDIASDADIVAADMTPTATMDFAHMTTGDMAQAPAAADMTPIYDPNTPNTVGWGGPCVQSIDCHQQPLGPISGDVYRVEEGTFCENSKCVRHVTEGCYYVWAGQPSYQGYEQCTVGNNGTDTNGYQKVVCNSTCIQGVPAY